MIADRGVFKRMQEQVRDNYSVPFEIPDLTIEEAIRIASDTGTFSTDYESPLLETVVDLLEELERPDCYYDCLQIAGTNGKTSTSRFTAAILRGEGLSTGLFASPHLVRFPDRLEINGRVVSDEVFCHGVSAAFEAGKRVNARRVSAGKKPYFVSPFDILTVAGLVVYAEAQVDVAVLEVGMGGRWDATSATDPVAVAITGIGLDHMKWLGDTLAKIAAEKAAVIKPGRKVVLGESVHEATVQPVMDDRCRECGVVPWVSNHAVTRVPECLGGALEFSTTTARAIYTPHMVKPSYQTQNAACAIALSEAYLGRELDHAKLDASLMACPTPGRFDILSTSPLRLIDACHNPQSCENFIASLDEIEPDVAKRPALLTAELADKDVSGILDVLVPAFPAIVVTKTDNKRALSAEDLARMVRAKLAELGRPETDLLGVFDCVDEALAFFDRDDAPFVAAGTITLAGEVAASLRGF